MKIKKFTGFDENGNLPKGVYNMTLEELEKLFSTTNKRKEIIHEFEPPRRVDDGDSQTKNFFTKPKKKRMVF